MISRTRVATQSIVRSLNDGETDQLMAYYSTLVR